MATGTWDTVTISGRSFGYEIWTEGRLWWRGEVPIALDTETEPIADERTPPRVALAVASDGRRHVLIHPDRLAAFLLEHREACLVGHNIQFDFAVVDQHLGRRGEAAARRVLWDACDQGRLHDTQILDMLLQLATGKYRKAGRSGGDDAATKVYPGNLAEVAADYTSLALDKSDPFRLRFGELLGLREEDWDGVDVGFFQYAVADAIATHRLYPALCDAAAQETVAYGFDRTASRFEVWPDAPQRFGWLSEVVQVKASVALAHMFRQGVRVDQEKVRLLSVRYRQELDSVVETLRRDFPEALTFQRDGSLKQTPKAGTPSLADGKLIPLLTRIGEELHAAGRLVELPRSQGKKGGVSKSIKDWRPFVPFHPFLGLWTEMKRLERLLGFVAGLDVPVLHCEYALLTRTGRTACAKSRRSELPGANLQQMPKAPEFRELFLPRAPDERLFIGDYAAIELRTLAAVCRARFGRSKLGDVITEGIDPHAFTAAAIQNLTLEEFLGLKTTDKSLFRQRRQAAKAVNFGVPGGLGAKTLMAYAEANYGVTMTLKEAEDFRRRLIDDVYPELNDQDGYLADSAMKALASNLGASEEQVWAFLDRPNRRSPFAARGVANVVRGVTKASPNYQQRVWEGLYRLAHASSRLDPAVLQAIRERKGSQFLYDRLYFQRAATLTGRIRAGVGYTDSKNTPFQSLAADGAKLALWDLLYRGYNVYGFVHDEILVSVPAATADEDAARIERIMLDAMEGVLGGIPAACERCVSDCWKKPD